MHMYTLLHLKWIINKELLCSALTLLSVMLQPGEWIHEYIWLSPFTVHLVNNINSIVNCLHPNAEYKIKKNNVKLKDN